MTAETKRCARCNAWCYMAKPDGAPPMLFDAERQEGGPWQLYMRGGASFAKPSDQAVEAEQTGRTEHSTTCAANAVVFQSAARREPATAEPEQVDMVGHRHGDRVRQALMASKGGRDWSNYMDKTRGRKS